MDIGGIVFDPIAALFSKPVCFLPMMLYALLFGGILLGALFSSVPLGIGAHTVLPTASVILASVILIVIFAILMIVFVTPFIFGVYLSLAMQMRTGNKQLSLGAAVNRAKQKYLSLVGASFIVSLVAVAVFGVLHFLLAAPLIFNVNLGFAGAAIVALILILLMIVAAAAIIIYFFQALATVVIEDKKAVAAVKRSIEIGKKYPWSILGVVLLLTVIAFVISLILNIIVGTMAIGLVLYSPLAAFFIVAIISIIVSGALGAWMAMVPGTFYYAYVAKKQKK